MERPHALTVLNTLRHPRAVTILTIVHATRGTILTHRRIAYWTAMWVKRAAVVLATLAQLESTNRLPVPVNVRHARHLQWLQVLVPLR